MKRAVILGCSPSIHAYWRKSTRDLFSDVGGNTGNLAFEFAVASHLPGHLKLMDLSLDPAVVREQADVIVLPLANQLGSHTDLEQEARALEKFRLPVVAVGLGAQSELDLNERIHLTPGTDRWIRTIASLSPLSGTANIGLRGAYTLEQMSRLGLERNCVITGCPSNLINTNNNIPSLKRKNNAQPNFLAINAGLPYIPNLRQIERMLASFVRAGDVYITQHDLPLLQLARAEFEEMADRFEMCREYILPGLSSDEFKNWCRTYSHTFFNAEAWLDFLRRFDFVVGTRIHGAILAIQAGTPSGCIAIDNRTLELCETMKIPHVRFDKFPDDLPRSELASIFEFDIESYEKNRKQLSKIYVDMLIAADLRIDAELRDYAGK